MLWMLLSCLSPPAAVAPAPTPPRAPAPGPSAPTWPAPLQARLAAAWRDRDPTPPRTRHLHDDGTPRFINRLFMESSPYLRQHAHNPVDWRPWGPDALAEAAALGRPILLSVGYATCHWCHVMEEESFEDPEIAAFLNAHFVPIKVDREERPDVDALYMTAVQLLSGRGGWPMTVVLTPAGEPFFAATYLPARDGDRGMGTGFLTILKRLSAAWTDEGERVASQAARLTAAVQQVLAAPTPGTELPSTATLAAAADAWASSYDADNGGRVGAPKFPSHLPIRPLLRAWRLTGDDALRTMAAHTLRAMAASGMRDQLGGGFHRYSTDAAWRVPHFEIMLYDQALLVEAYLDGWRATGDPALATVAREVLDATVRDLRQPSGAFGSALDADSVGPDGEREEGLSYTWTPEEVAEVLSSANADAACKAWGVTSAGNLDGRSVLYRPEGLGADDLDPLRSRLLAARSQRPPPLTDDKVLAGWNGLIIGAFADASLALDEPRYAAIAVEALTAVLGTLRKDGRLKRSWRGDVRHAAASEDLAFLAAAAVSTFEATGDPRWIDEALSLHAELDDHYATPDGIWYQTPDDGEALLARAAPVRDGAVPAASSVHTDTLLRLAALTGADAFRARADRALTALAPTLAERPDTAPELLRAVARRHSPGVEMVLVVPDGTDAAPLRDVWRRRYLPDGVFVQTQPGDAGSMGRVRLAEDKVAHDGQPTGYVCERGSCRQPTTDPGVLAAQLDALIRAQAGSPSPG
ncbi:MAG: hypothetical protein ACI9K2_003958 [Myxococcota bacterium]|jgi:uncharacterized protein YyaL (SSP411 family)